jgi:hypothetical protein
MVRKLRHRQRKGRQQSRRTYCHRATSRLHSQVTLAQRANGLRNELRQQNTQVLGPHMSFVDTDLTKGVDVAKASPDTIVQSAFDALKSGASEVLADESSKQIKRGLTAAIPVYL